MTSLQEQQARAREEWKKAERCNDHDCDYCQEHDIILDEIVARVRTETLDAVEAGMPASQDAREAHVGIADEVIRLGELGYAEGMNACRSVILAHLRTLRDIKS